ncbi:MAG: hypothetical protein KatS3mg110_1350 [Pirellulaceae bacterium]|nr:MAG: hypothetical protein KatS3mg110_1350 [Pirellulaceae bacterium]
MRNLRRGGGRGRLMKNFWFGSLAATAGAAAWRLPLQAKLKIVLHRCEPASWVTHTAGTAVPHSAWRLISAPNTNFGSKPVTCFVLDRHPARILIEATPTGNPAIPGTPSSENFRKARNWQSIATGLFLMAIQYQVSAVHHRTHRQLHPSSAIATVAVPQGKRVKYRECVAGFGSLTPQLAPRSMKNLVCSCKW